MLNYLLIFCEKRNRRNFEDFIAKSQKESIIANWDNFVNIDKLVLILIK